MIFGLPAHLVFEPPVENNLGCAEDQLLMLAKAPECIPALIEHRSFAFILFDEPFCVADQLFSSILERNVRLIETCDMRI